LQYLKINNYDNEIEDFRRLKLLRKLSFGYFDYINNIDKIFDPSQIIELSIEEEIKNTEQLNLFVNLKKLEITGKDEKVNYKKLLPHMRALTTLTLNFNAFK
jgi:hypothetical protein